MILGGFLRIDLKRRTKARGAFSRDRKMAKGFRLVKLAPKRQVEGRSKADHHLKATSVRGKAGRQRKSETTRRKTERLKEWAEAEGDSTRQE